MRIRAALTALLFVGAALGPALAASAGPVTTPAGGPPPGAGGQPSTLSVVYHDVSPPLRSIPPAAHRPGLFVRDQPQPPAPPSGGPDTALQTTAGPTAAPGTSSGNITGIGQGFTGPQGTFTVQYAPPDTNGDVGLSDYVEVVNVDLAVFSKSTRTVRYGPVATNTVWSGVGGGCQTNNDGDATVKYDRVANRWIIQQFSISTTPYLDCVAVSTTGDPTGSYYRYVISGFGNYMPDYPKVGIWADGYYLTFNRFYLARTFSGAGVCALNRSAMLSGSSFTAQCYNTSTSYASLLPSDADGGAAMAPPAGAPDYLMSFGSNTLYLWKFHVDWANSANSSFSGPTSIPVAGFSTACGGGTCIPQPGTSQQLDSLGDRLMYRLSYRNFGDHESLVVTHSVAAGGSTGIRWYEIRSPGAAAPTVFQQGTYAPDSSYRWMGSAAMDRAGDIAVGYSVSSSGIFPSLRYTGWQNGVDATGVLESEASMVAGTGSQLTNLSRWGDYASMSVDPADDCTFWFAGEYLTGNGTWNWSTAIGTFVFPTCGATTNGALSFSPGAQTLTAGSASTAMSVSLSNPAPTGGASVTLSTSSAGGGFSTSQTGSFTSTLALPVSAGASSTPTFYYQDTSAGTPTLTASATGWTPGTQSETVNPAQLTSITVSPSSATVASGGARSFSATGADRYGNVIAVSPAWSLDVPIGTLSPSSGASTVFTAGSSPGSATLSAAQGGVTGSASVTVTTLAAMNVTVTTGTSTQKHGTYRTPVTVTAKDATTGAGISGASVALQIFAGQCPATGTSVASGSGTTNTSGQAGFTFSTKTPGTYCAVGTVTAGGYAQGSGSTTFTN